MTTAEIVAIGERFPRFTLRRVWWASEVWCGNGLPPQVENGWWAVAIEEGGFYSFGPTPVIAIERAVAGLVGAA